MERRGGAGPDSFFGLLSKIPQRSPLPGARGKGGRTLAACDGQAAAGLPPASLFHPLPPPFVCPLQFAGSGSRSIGGETLAAVLLTGLRQGWKPGRAKTPTRSLGGGLVYESPARRLACAGALGKHSPTEGVMGAAAGEGRQAARDAVPPQPR